MAIKTRVSVHSWKDVCATLFAAVAFSVLTACAGSPTKESTGELIDDSTITTKVKAVFVKDKTVSATAVHVETFKGNVQLSGFVKSETEKQRAAELARSVGGVKTVTNSLEVK